MNTNGKTLKAWSYSTYSSWRKCPAQIGYGKVLRVFVPEPPPNETLQRGIDVHKSAELYVAAEKRPPALRDELKKFKPELEVFRKARAKPELEWAFTLDWKPCGWSDWNAAWLRVKADLIHETPSDNLVHIVDYKTGRVYPDHAQQRSLYALGALQMHKLGLLASSVKASDLSIKVEHWYVDQWGDRDRATELYKGKDLAKLKRQWTQRVEPMLNDTKFEAKPGRHCQWCKFNCNTGGPCRAD